MRAPPLRTSQRIVVVVAFTAAASVAVANASAEDHTEGYRDVRVWERMFIPNHVEIEAGMSVAWWWDPVQTDQSSHSVTSQPGAPETFDEPPGCGETRPCIGPPTGYNQQGAGRTFNVPGTYAYYCKFHGRSDVPPDPDADVWDQPCGMCGIVTVRPASQPDPAPTPQPERENAPTPPPPTTRHEPAAGSQTTQPGLDPTETQNDTTDTTNTDPLPEPDEHDPHQDEKDDGRVAAGSNDGPSTRLSALATILAAAALLIAGTPTLHARIRRRQGIR